MLQKRLTRTGNACSPKLEELLGYIDDLKRSPEVKEAYMTFEEYVESERREVRYEVRNEMRGEIEKAHAERDAAVNKCNAAVNERDAIREELDAKDEALNAKDEEINLVVRERDAAISDRDTALKRVKELEKMLETR